MSEVSLYNLTCDLMQKIANNVTNYDIAEISAAAYKSGFEVVNNACIYTHNCYEIILHYESLIDEPEDLSGGKTFTAENWIDAMQAHAFNIAVEYINSQISEMLENIESCATELSATLTEYLSSDDFDQDQFKVSHTDIMMVYNGSVTLENEVNVHISKNQDQNSVACIKTKCGLYIYFTWKSE